ncbi:dihydrofolate reductase [Aerococcaceae bacterium zg-ZUI334]|uniref:dihydrofolate reductase n=1 Tax=Aerococcaceae TaxID=186827 RepID=UPI0013B74CC2|nr:MULTISPECIES: dihydrofolate reductase [unclassified Facklamia]MBR7928343.1 dihydrofolate reductase [Aerococcaceae bacterium zg-ZUI334]NEW65363.1 dihydrofolate reductase [Facklamia sp. 252]NEW68515.1 dihydrofolate reductase [Facklamia sp. 253]QQD64889.1 dihydrofolate reductase [Aerococcaceae bacterium zg-252]
MITFIYAQDEQGGIGYQNQLPWHLPNDLKFFKAQTMGKTIVMGRKTFESMGCRLLPGRNTVVVTRDTSYKQEIVGLTVLSTVDEVLRMSEQEPLMVIGGAQLFNTLLPYADCVIRTQIKAVFDSDVFMPELDATKWHCEKIEQGIMDEKNQIPHQFEWWKKCE